MSGVAVVGRPSDVGGPAGGGGRPDLRHSDEPWARAADGAEALRTHLAPVPAELATAHGGLSAGAGALSALAELATVRTSWERRFAAAQGECAGLAGKLRAVVRERSSTNEAVRRSFAESADGAGAR
ncbi:hypothetical protein OG909_17395 [Streptomyces sp. NBC_01754]|uniref:hypothetical protein n=1 Tax=Streptomyces sp. NBC_01754 TaxID=2975930 RepID=UPI002DDAB0A0|nr:hypothetical protein [Streptomyces sp. NBC_01754]WSC93899.1 hypothetical protein OG909_17395 [Streptomyces sp. NBC_01754]